MKPIFKYLIAALLIFGAGHMTAQTNNEPAKKEDNKSPKSERAKRRADKKKWKEARKRKRAEEKMIRDHHKRIQTKNVNKRMKKSKKRAQRNNDNKREFFLKRWFSRKH